MNILALWVNRGQGRLKLRRCFRREVKAFEHALKNAIENGDARVDLNSICIPQTIAGSSSRGFCTIGQTHWFYHLESKAIVAAYLS